jgi:hypothetical protein
MSLVKRENIVPRELGRLTSDRNTKYDLRHYNQNRIWHECIGQRTVRTNEKPSQNLRFQIIYNRQI